MALEEIATEVIETLDAYAQEVVEYCRANGLDEKQLYDMIIIKRENPLKKEFLSIGFSTVAHPFGAGVDVSYKFSEMLGERGIEKNRVKHFNYSQDPKDRPESEKSMELADAIHGQLSQQGNYSGVYHIDRHFGNPFGNIKYEPHFELSKKISIK